MKYDIGDRVALSSSAIDATTNQSLDKGLVGEVQECFGQMGAYMVNFGGDIGKKLIYEHRLYSLSGEGKQVKQEPGLAGAILAQLKDLATKDPIRFAVLVRVVRQFGNLPSEAHRLDRKSDTYTFEALRTISHTSSLVTTLTSGEAVLIDRVVCQVIQANVLGRSPNFYFGTRAK